MIEIVDKSKEYQPDTPNAVIGCVKCLMQLALVILLIKTIWSAYIVSTIVKLPSEPFML